MGPQTAQRRVGDDAAAVAHGAQQGIRGIEDAVGELVDQHGLAGRFGIGARYGTRIIWLVVLEWL